jgi:hypothetical protein
MASALAKSMLLISSSHFARRREVRSGETRNGPSNGGRQFGGVAADDE